MSLIGGFMKSITGIPGTIWRWCWSKLDVDFRRMCVMSSLHAQLIVCTDGECEKMQKLNSKLNLLGDVDAMRLPTLFAPKIWRGVKPLAKMDHLNDRYFERLVRMTPCWLLYTDKQTFIRELKVMVGYCVEEYNLQVQM